MTDETYNPERKTSIAYLALLSRVPQSVKDQIDKYRSTREPGRKQLMRQVEDYDKATRQRVTEILQVYEMSLQSHSRTFSLRDKERER